MRILLVQPAKAPVTMGGQDIHLFEPLALEYLAAGVADHHDFIHTLLPTRLPLKDFYGECHRLYRQAVSPATGMSLLTKFPLRQIPGMLVS